MIIIKGCHVGLHFNLQGQLFFFCIQRKQKKPAQTVLTLLNYSCSIDL